MGRLIILAAVLIIVAVLVTVAISSSVSTRTATAEEQARITQACVDCHYENGLSNTGPHSLIEGTSCFSCHDNAHFLHANAECINCHSGTAGLKTADRAHTALQWLGIAVAGLLAAVLTLNYLMVRRRSGAEEEGNGETDR